MSLLVKHLFMFYRGVRFIEAKGVPKLVAYFDSCTSWFIKQFKWFLLKTHFLGENPVLNSAPDEIESLMLSGVQFQVTYRSSKNDQANTPSRKVYSAKKNTPKAPIPDGKTTLVLVLPRDLTKPRALLTVRRATDSADHRSSSGTWRRAVEPATR